MSRAENLRTWFERHYGDDCTPWIWPATASACFLLILSIALIVGDLTHVE